MKPIALAFSLVVLATAAYAAAPFPLVPGEAVLTCFSDNNPNAPVVAAFDIRNTASAPGFNQNWAAPVVHLGTWNQAQLGEVFGVTLDDAQNPNIYLSSTVIYKSTYTGIAQTAAGTGRVFRIDGTSGIAATLPVLVGTPLPNTGQGLGDVAYDRTHNQLLVTDFYDGKIYRLNPVTGAQLGPPFDPFTPFNPSQSTANGFAPLGERLWGVGVFQSRVYFGVWTSDKKTGPPNSVWSVALNAAGAFIGTERLEVTLPPLAGQTMPVADIAFSGTGRMLLAEHGMESTFTEIDSQPHQSRVLEYKLVGTSWVPSSNTYSIGVNNGTNSSGGVDFACPTANGVPHVVATGDALHYSSPDHIYGMQIFPDTGGSISNSYLVDADGNTTPIQANVDKTQIGDVEVVNTCDVQCFESRITKVLCAADGTGDYFVTFTLKNLSPQTIYYAYITGLSPAGATATPNFINLSTTPVAPGGGPVTIGPIRIHGAPPGALSFNVSIHNKDLEECCAARVTVDLPQCNCAQITGTSGPFCTLHGTTSTYTFTVQNLFNGPVSYVLLTPDTPANTTFSNYVFDLTANPMVMGASRTFSVTIGGVAGGQNVCFRISLHNANFVTCCSILQCVTMPRCFDWKHLVVTGPGTTASVNGDWLVLDNPNRAPDAVFPLAPDDTGFDIRWLPIEMASLAPGAYVEQRVTGTVDGSAAQTLTTMRTVRTADGAELRTTFPALGSTRYTYEFYREGALVARQTGVPSDVPAIVKQSLNITTDAHFSTSGVPASEEGGTPCDGPGPGCLFSGYTFQEASVFRIAGSPAITADEVRVIPEDGALTSTIRLTALGFHAEGLRQVTLTELTVHPDRVEGGTTGTTTTSLNTNAADWQVVAPGAERPAQVVTAPPAAWPAPLTNSQWISVDATGFSISGTTQLAFQRCFCLGSSGAATLDLQVRADNEVSSVLLNGHVLGGPGGGFLGPLLSIHRAGTIGDGFFVAGSNCVRVEVTDFGGYTGMNAIGTVIGPSCLP